MTCAWVGRGWGIHIPYTAPHYHGAAIGGQCTARQGALKGEGRTWGVHGLGGCSIHKGKVKLTLSCSHACHMKGRSIPLFPGAVLVNLLAHGFDHSLLTGALHIGVLLKPQVGKRSKCPKKNKSTALQKRPKWPKIINLPPSKNGQNGQK